MTGESSSIIAIVLLMGYFYLRAGRKNYAMVVFPLAIVPATYLLAYYLTPYLSDLLSLQKNWLFIGIMLAGLIFATLITFHFSRKIESKSSRKIFISIIPFFNLALTILYFIDTLDI